MYLSCIFIPIYSFLLISLFGKKFGRVGSIFLIVLLLFVSFFFACLLVYEIIFSNQICLIKLLNWISSEFFIIIWGFNFDNLTVIMLFVIISISLLVHIYSLDYMQADVHLTRFMAYLSLFTFFMLMLVTSDNIVQMFLGWEGVGLVSFLLINFWFTRLEANKAAIKAILMNRICDFGIILVIVLCFIIFRSLEYSIIFSMSSWFNNEFLIFFNIFFKKIDLICFFLFIGAIGKSAQLGMHPWLAAAMEGPTPVSALLHAATMVTAGVFIIFRFSFLIEYSINILFFITLIGSLTAFFASFVAIFQNDIKKVIACSTCSQLGYMFFISGLSHYDIAFFHLICHAFFKALLFLNAGFIIHIFGKIQDMRLMGGLIILMPFSYLVFFFGSLSLMGFPFLTGFYSKDILLEVTYSQFSFFSGFSYFLGNLAVIFTAFYSIKVIFLVFLSKTRSYIMYISYIIDISWIYFIIFWILGLFSIFFGYIFFDLFLGIGNIYLNGSIYILPFNYLFFESEFIYIFIKFIPFLLNIFSWSLFFFIYFKYQYFFNFFYIYLFLTTKFIFFYLFGYTLWHFTYFISYIVFYNIYFIYFYVLLLIEKGILELFGGWGIPQWFWSYYYNFIYSILNTSLDIQFFYIVIAVFLLVSFIFFFEWTIFYNLIFGYKLFFKSLINFIFFFNLFLLSIFLNFK